MRCPFDAIRLAVTAAIRCRYNGNEVSENGVRDPLSFVSYIYNGIVEVVLYSLSRHTCL